jgi:C-terminal processing protease CtpA/Prc
MDLSRLGGRWKGLAAALALFAAAPSAAQDAQARSTDGPIPAETIRADFAALYEGLQAAHFDLYARTGRAAYDRLYARMRRSFTHPLPRFDVARRFQHFVAFGHVAHARIDEAYRAYAAYLAGGGKAFPLSLRVVGRRAFVVDDRSGATGIAVGDEVTHLDGRPIGTWLARCRRNLSADTDYMANALIELDLPMLLWLERGPSENFRLRLRRTDGRAAGLLLAARTRAEMQAVAAGRPQRLDLGASDQSAEIIAPGIAYLRPGAFYNAEPGAADPYDNRAFGRFIDSAFESFLAAGADRLIVDLRDNPGGDSAFSDLMVAWFADRPWRFASAFRIKVSPQAMESNRRRLETATGAAAEVTRRFAEAYAGARPGDVVDFPITAGQPRSGRRFTGRVFVLVNRNSFSNAVAVAATVQDHGFGTIIGEETSDLATTYGAMETFTLPRTGLTVGFPKAHIVRPNGDLAARGVVPDLRIETPLWEGPEDPVLRHAVGIAAGP